MTISKRKEVGQYVKTHTAKENTWKPKEEKKEDVDEFNLPF